MNLAFSGLIFDAVGVVFLAIAFLGRLEAGETISVKTAGSDEYSHYHWESLPEKVKRQTDGVLGSILLLFGFIFQALHQLDFRAGAWPCALIPLLFLFVCLYASNLRDAWVQRRVKLIKREMIELLPMPRSV